MLDQVDLYEDMSQVGVVVRNSYNWDKHGQGVPSRGWKGLFSKTEPTFFDFGLNIRQKFSEGVMRRHLALSGGEVNVQWAVESFTVHKNGSSHPVEVALRQTRSNETKLVSWYVFTHVKEDSR